MKWRKKGEKQAQKPEVLAVQTAWEEPFAHFSSCWEKWAAGGTVSMKNTAIGRKASRRRR